MLVIDAHCDAPSQIYRGRDYCSDNHFPVAQVDFPKMRKGGVGASFFALYIPSSLKDSDATDYAFRLLEATEREVSRLCSGATLARSADEVLKNRAEGRLSILLGLENASAIRKDLSILEKLYERGVRYVTLTHSEDNQVCDSCTGSGYWGGLSPFGKELVREMNSMGMLVDVAHCSADTVRDCLEISSRPIVDTHCCCSALSSHKRNLSDELMKGISSEGGVVCISIYPPFLSDEFSAILSSSGLLERMSVEDDWIADPSNERKFAAWNDVVRSLQGLPRPGIELFLEHMSHALEVCGSEAVGIGTDYDGIAVTPAGLEDISSFRKLSGAISEMYGQEISERVLGLNLLRLLR